jgi:hypothetical protein
MDGTVRVTAAGGLSNGSASSHTGHTRLPADTDFSPFAAGPRDGRNTLTEATAEDIPVFAEGMFATAAGDTDGSVDRLPKSRDTTKAL